MNYCSLYGRLANDVRQIQMKIPDTAMVVCSIAVDIDSRDKQETERFGLVCFGGHAKSLVRHAKGEPLSVSGRLQLNIDQNEQDVRVRQLRVVVDSLIGARSARPGGKRPSNTKAAARPTQYPAEFSDPIPI